MNIIQNSVLGIDLSLNGTGLCVLGGDGVIKHSERITLNTNKANKIKGFKRVQFVKRSIFKIIKDYKITHIAIEGYSFGSKGRSIIDLGEMGGVIRNSVMEEYPHIIMIEVPPKSLKKIYAGNGNADKDMMAAEIQKKYNHTFETNDECDAYALSRIFLDFNDFSQFERVE
jgi:Holliday junction resolvasome RuvABC endonuclease subunit